jgi:hypothetical protein
MIIKCKFEGASANCPHDLDICCGICSFKDGCGNRCTCTDHQTCPDAEVIDESLTAFKSSVPDTIGKITQLIKLKKQLDDQEKELKATLVKAMEHYGVKVFENDQIKMTYVAPTTRSTIDSTRLKKDHPDIVKEYTKISDVSASVRVTLKGGDK